MKLLLAQTTAAVLTSSVAAISCQNITVPVSVTARNGNYNLSAPRNDIEVTNFALEVTRPGINFTEKVLQGYTTISGDYNISGTFCQPDNGQSKTLQILSHGLSADRSYWDVSLNDYNYSYVRQAVDVHNYAAFFYDRLGAGLSSHPDPINVTQVWMEAEVLAALTNMSRDGDLPGTNNTKFEKIIHVGHSFGSVLSNLLTTLYPHISDAIVLTGFSQNYTWQPEVIFGGNLLQANNKSQFADLQNGYALIGDISAVQLLFFGPGDYAPELLEAATVSTIPIAMGELLNSEGYTTHNNTFAGPVLLVAGEYDIPFCGGNCLNTGNPAIPSIPADAKKFYPNAQALNATIIPRAGHVLNLQYSHIQAYDTIFQFLAEQNLAPVSGANRQTLIT